MTKNKGVALILSIIILTAVLAIALTAGKVFTDKIKMSRSTSDSMKAYYAAESGIEYALYRIKNGLAIEDSHKCDNWQPVDGASYCLKQEGDSIKAIGKAREARRGIEVQVAQAAATGISEIETLSYSLPNPTSATTRGVCINAGYTDTTGSYYIKDRNIFGLTTGQAVDAVDLFANEVLYVQCYK